GSAASNSWRPTGRGSGRAGITAATTCVATRGSRSDSAPTPSTPAVGGREPAKLGSYSHRLIPYTAPVARPGDAGMLPSPGLPPTLTAPAAPVPRDAAPTPTGPAPTVTVLRADTAGEVWVTATVHVKQKQIRVVTVTENGNTTTKQTE